MTMKKPLVVILAGGVGTRFEPLATNKTLIPFLGQPLLQHLLEMIEDAGFEEVLIATNSENETWLKQYTTTKMVIQTRLQEKPLGMADAMLKLEEAIGDLPILVMNAADIIDPSFFDTLLKEAQKSYAYITGMKVRSHFIGGYLKVDGDRVMEIVERPAKGSEPSDMVNLVFHYFSQPTDFFQYLKTTEAKGDDHYERALSAMMKEKQVICIPYDGSWQKLKFSHYVLDMMNLFFKQLFLGSSKSFFAKSAQVSKNAVIEGPVYVDEGAEIQDFAVVKGPAYIGRNVVVGSHSLVRQSMIEENSVIGFGSEVARSYIGPRCMLHHNFIGDSILEADVNPSYGTCTANLRLDNGFVKVKLPGKVVETQRTKLGTIIAKGAFLGINCSIMPGVTIGKNARVFPHKVITQAVEADKTLK